MKIEEPKMTSNIFFKLYSKNFLVESNLDDMDEEELLRRAQELSLQDDAPISQNGYISNIYKT